MPIDLSRTYLHLVGETDVHEIPVDADFWPRIGERTELHAHRMVMRFDFEESWPTWEIHPAGEEVVVVLSGAMELILDLPEGPQRTRLGPGEAAVVPRGVWHTADVSEPTSALFLTHGRGTENKPRA